MGVKLPTAKFTAQYIGRYTKRPSVAQSRIKDYDGEFVTFEYEDKHEKVHRLLKLPVLEFIGRLTRHIPEKNFRQIRYAGLYANRSRTHDLLVARTLLCLRQGKPIKSLDWRHRRKLQTGFDPFVCCHCGSQLKLIKIVYKSRDGPLEEINFDE